MAGRRNKASNKQRRKTGTNNADGSTSASVGPTNAGPTNATTTTFTSSQQQQQLQQQQFQQQENENGAVGGGSSQLPSLPSSSFIGQNYYSPYASGNGNGNADGNSNHGGDGNGNGGGTGNGSGNGSGQGGYQAGGSSPLSPNYDKCHNNDDPCCKAVKDIVRMIFPEVDSSYLFENNNMNAAAATRRSSATSCSKSKGQGGKGSQQSQGSNSAAAPSIAADWNDQEEEEDSNSDLNFKKNKTQGNNGNKNGNQATALLSLMVRDYILQDRETRRGEGKKSKGKGKKSQGDSKEAGSISSSTAATPSGSGSGATNKATMGLSKSQKKRLKRNKKKNTSAAAAALESGPGTTSTADMSTNINICGDANDGSKEAKSSAHLPQDQKVENKIDAFLDEILRNNNNNSNEQQQQQNKSSAKNMNIPQHPNPYAIPKGRSMTSLLQYIHERYIHSVAEEQSQTSSGGGSIISGGGSRKQQGKKISQTSNSSSLSSSLGSSFQSSSLGNSLNSNSSIKSKASASANTPCNFMPSIALQEIYNVITSIQCRQCQYACTTFMNQISYNTSFRYSGGSDKWGSNKSLGGSNMPNLEVDCGAGGGSEAFIKKSARYHMIRLDQDSAAKTPGEDMKRSNSGRSLGSGSNLAIPVSGGCNFDGNNEDLDIENAMRYELMEEGDSCLAATSTADDDSISKKQLNGLQLDIVMDVISGQKQIELDVTNAPTCFNADASQPNEASQSLVFSMENFECLVRDVILPCGLPAFGSPAPREKISEEDINTLQKDSKALFHEIVDKISLLNSTISKAKVLLDDAEESSRASTPFNPKAMKYLKNCSDSQLQYIRIFRELLLKLNQRTFMLRTIKHDYQKWATKLINKLWDAYETCIQSLIEPSLRHIWKVMQLDSNRTGSVPLLFNNPTQREYLRQLLLNKSNVLLRLHDQMEGILFPNSFQIDLENTTSKPFPIFSRLVTLGVYFDTVNKVEDGVGGNYVAILDKRNELIFETILQTDITKIKELQSNRCRSLMEIAEEQLQSVEEDLNKTALNKKDDLTWTAHKIMTEECLVVNLDLGPSLDHDLQKLRHLCELVKNVLNQGRFRDEIVALSSISKSNEHVKTPAAIVDLSENLHTDRVIKANENNSQLKCEGGGGRRRIAGILSVCLYNWLQKKCLEWHADLTQNELLQSLFQEDESIKPLPSKKKKKRKKKSALQTSNGGDGNGETVNSLKDTTRTAEKSDANPITMEAKPEIVEEKIELKDETDATAISEAEIEKEKIDLVEPKGEHDVSDKADAVDSNPRQMQSSLIPQDEFLPSADDSDILERDEISESRYIPQVGISDGGTTISAEEFLCNRLDEALKANDVHFI